MSRAEVVLNPITTDRLRRLLMTDYYIYYYDVDNNISRLNLKSVKEISVTSAFITVHRHLLSSVTFKTCYDTAEEAFEEARITWGV